MSEARRHDLHDTLDALDPAERLLPKPSSGHESLEMGRTLLAPEDPRAAPISAPSWLPIIDPESYEILGELARGGIGRVLSANDTRLNRLVAIKELLGSVGEMAESRFVREALLTARLQHPSIVPLYEAGRWPSGAPFYAMKLVTGRSLEDVIAERPLLSKRLALLPHVLAVAEAMAYAHCEQIIHRDLKPANVLVGAFGETVVIDWGLAKDLALAEAEAPFEEPAAPSEPLPSRPSRRLGPGTTPPAEALTLHGAVMGTPAYMPPEQASGSNVDERADVYALGAILYHLLAGACPYEGETSVQVLRQVQEGPPEPLATRQPGIPEDLLTIVNKAMARERTSRYRSAQELAEDLRRFQTGQIVGAHSYSRGERLRRFGRRYRAALAVAAVAILVLAITGAISVRRIMSESRRAREKQAVSEQAERRAVDRADDLTLVEARAAVERDPNQAIGWLKSLSPSFQRWPVARLVAADARAQGIAAVLRGHTGVINAMAYSPDGRLLATASDDHTIRLWDPAAPAQTRIFVGHTDEAWAVIFSRDGSLLVTGGKDRTIRIWDVKTGTSRVLAGHTAPVTQVAFAGPDRIVSSSDDGTVRLWDVKTGEARGVLGGPMVIRTFAVAPDGRTVACGGRDNLLRLWDLETGEVRSLPGHSAGIEGVVFSPDSATIVTRDVDGMVRRWDPTTGTSRVLGERLGDYVFGAPPFGKLVISPDGKTLAAASDGSFVRVWDLASGAMRRLDGPLGRTGWLAFSPDGKLLATASFDHAAHVWDLATGVSRVFHGFSSEVSGVAFSPDGRVLAASGGDGTVRLFPVATTPSRVLLDAHSPLLTLDLSPDQERVLAAGKDGIVRLVDLTSGQLTLFEGHEGAVIAARVSPDGQLVATVGRDETTRIWDLTGHEIWSSRIGSPWSMLAFSPDSRLVATGGEHDAVHLVDVDTGAARELVGHEAPIAAVAFSADGAQLVSSSFDHTIRRWDLATGASRVLRGHEGAVYGVAFAPDGTSLASGGEDHSLRLWDLATGQSRRADAGGGGIMQLAFTADGKTLFTCDHFDTSVRVWDTTSLTQRAALSGHQGVVTHFNVTPDDRRLASTSVDGTVRLWDLASGESRVLHGHTGPVTAVAFTADGAQILSASEDGTVRAWPDDLPDDPAALRAWIEAATPER